MHRQLGGSTEDDMNKISVIGHFFPLSNHALRSVCRPLYASLLDRGRHIRIQRHIRWLHNSVLKAVLRPAFRRRNTTTCVDSHHQRRPFGVDTVHIADLNKRLHREHEKLKGMLRHHTLVSVDERERAKHAKSNIPCDGFFAEGHAIAPCVPSTPPRPVRSPVVISSKCRKFFCSAFVW